MAYPLLTFFTGMLVGIFLFSLILVSYRDNWWELMWGLIRKGSRE